MCIFNLNSMLGVNSSPQHVAPFPNIPPQNLRNGAPSPPRGGPYFVSRRRRFCVGWGRVDSLFVDVDRSIRQESEIGSLS